MQSAAFAGQSTLSEMRVLGSFANAQWTIPTAINERGDVVGVANNLNHTGQDAAFIWTRENGFQLIAFDASVSDINNRGDVVGYRCEWYADDYGNTQCRPHGFVWNLRTGLTELDTIVPVAINNKGDVAGTCLNIGVACALIGGDLHTYPCAGDCGTGVYGLNDRGDVLVNEFDPIDGDKATIYPSHGDPIDVIEGLANDINNARTVVLYKALWTPRGQILPSVDIDGFFYQVNASGLTVGSRFMTDRIERRAIAWDPKQDELIELAPNDVHSEATAVNNRGEVAGIVAGNVYSTHEAVVWVVRR
jgi:uncharacterized membrane protein